MQAIDALKAALAEANIDLSPAGLRLDLEPLRPGSESEFRLRLIGELGPVPRDGRIRISDGRLETYLTRAGEVSSFSFDLSTNSSVAIEPLYDGLLALTEAILTP